MRNRSSPTASIPVLQNGVVVAVTRRSVTLLVGDTLHSGTTASSSTDITVGDRVQFELKGKDYFITKRLLRTNELTRSYGEETKTLAANLDRIYIITAPLPTFQPLFVDKILVLARLQRIDPVLVIHKSDIGLEALDTLRQLYVTLGVPTLVTSTKIEEGLYPLITSLQDPSLSLAALVGVSGVGKSSILNSLIPDASREINTISSRTGTGKQTTTQARAFTYHPTTRTSPLLLIDLPGVQNFGLRHLSKESLTEGFIEIFSIGRSCEFDNCSHLSEKNCAVQDAVASGEIAQSRFTSYQQIYEEIQRRKKW